MRSPKFRLRDRKRSCVLGDSPKSFCQGFPDKVDFDAVDASCPAVAHLLQEDTSFEPYQGIPDRCSKSSFWKMGILPIPAMRIPAIFVS